MIAASTAWIVFAEHGALLAATGPEPTLARGAHWFLNVSGAEPIDLNQGALLLGATATDANDLIEAIERSSARLIVACPSCAGGYGSDQLAAKGLIRLAAPESLFAMAGTPVPVTSGFAVREVANARDVDAMVALFTAVHGYSTELTRTMFGAAVLEDRRFRGWLAWDGDVAVSFALITVAPGSLGLWEVMTLPEQRGRGAGRAIVASALAAVAASQLEPVGMTVFWSSPLGVPLYRALGFDVVDTFSTFALRPTARELADVGA